MNSVVLCPVEPDHAFDLSYIYGPADLRSYLTLAKMSF